VRFTPALSKEYELTRGVRARDGLVHIGIGIGARAARERSTMRRRAGARNLALAIAAGIVGVGAILAMLSVAGMRLAHRRAYAEVAAHCQRVSVLTVDHVRYFCAPVVRVETATPAAAPHSASPGTQL
jgi:hypothetical protein